MKPTKNRVYCNDCGRAKMLFAEQSKADNFIKFNAEEIEEENHKAPVRSYFCSSCGGWHVTSNPDAESFARGSWYENLITRIAEAKQKPKTKTQPKPQPMAKNKMKELVDLAIEGLSKAEGWLATGKAEKAKASAFQWIKTMTDGGIVNPFPYQKANLIIAKAGCMMMLNVNTMLDDSKAKAAMQLMQKVEECLKQIADIEDLAEYKETLTTAIAEAKSKLADSEHREEEQKKLKAIKKEVNALERSMRWASLYDLLCDITALTQRLTQIDPDCVSHEDFRDVVNQLYDVREKITSSLAIVA